MPDEKSINIPFPTDFNFRECTWFLDRGYNDCMHAVKGNVILKTLRVEGQAMLIRITAHEGCLRAEILVGAAGTDGEDGPAGTAAANRQQEFIRNYIREWLDLDR